jgi:hypothetical protein
MWWNNVTFSVDMDSNPDWWFIRSAFKDACDKGKTIFNFMRKKMVLKRLRRS